MPGGFFYFTISCPSNYPNEPPKVKFHTTGGGTVRFNPNLYANGKVCLSILGTWSGNSYPLYFGNNVDISLSILSFRARLGTCTNAIKSSLIDPSNSMFCSLLTLLFNVCSKYCSPLCANDLTTTNLASRCRISKHRRIIMTASDMKR